MPWEIRQNNDKFCVYKEGEEEPLKCYPTRDEAADYLAALYANEKSLGEGGSPEVAKRKTSGVMQFATPIPILEFKDEGDDWEVSGYVSIFNNVDLGNDIVLPGAFKNSLSSGRKVRFLLSHDPKSVLGVPKTLKEDKKGLFGRFKISKTRLGEETHQLLQDGAIDSFSFGYRSMDEDYREDGIRELKSIDLFEASLVAMPMNPDSIVTGFKEYMTLADKTRAITTEFTELLDELRGLFEKDRPLSATKQQEIEGLLETFSGLDAVRSDFQQILTAQPSSLVGSHQIHYQLAQLRKRYPEFQKE